MLAACQFADRYQTFCYWRHIWLGQQNKTWVLNVYRDSITFRRKLLVVQSSVLHTLKLQNAESF